MRYICECCVCYTNAKGVDKHVFEAQSEMVSGSKVVSNTENKVNFDDNAGSRVDDTSLGRSNYINNGQVPSTNIDQFLDRPIVIHQEQVSMGSDIAIELDVWKLLSDNGRIRAKFDKFAYFRGDMEITFAISGTPFNYGKLLMSYQPYYANNEVMTQIIAEMTADPVIFRPMLLVYLSQARDAMIIDIKENAPAVMQIPFISHKPMWRLFNEQTTSHEGVSFVDFEDAGRLFIYSINTPQSVNDTAGQKVTLTVYARFKNVQLGTLTATRMIAESQVDETKTGPVETVMSGISSVASALTSIPQLAPIATPIAQVSAVGSRIAHFFGWSKPVLDANRHEFKPDGFNNGMALIGNDTVKVMGADPKRMLDTGQSMFGCADDELAVEYICNRPSYLTTFTITPGVTPFSDAYWISGVSPILARKIVTLQTYVCPTTLMYAAIPFAHWRGDIVFTFEMVTSSFHRGKIMICFEPNVNHQNFAINNVQLNEQYCKVIDLQDAQAASFCVKWAADRAWRDIPVYTGQDTHSTVGVENLPSLYNGIIYVVPFTDVTTPDDSSLEVNVYVHGENMRFAVPTDQNMTQSRTAFVAQSEISNFTLQNGDISCLPINESTATMDNINLVHFGETIPSFRALLKRYQVRRTQSATFGSNYLNVVASIYPDISCTYGISPTTTDLISYLRYAYLAIRGSMRYRYKLNSQHEVYSYNHINVRLNQPKSAAPTYFSVASSTSYLPNNLVGGVTFLPTVNSAVEVDVPLYTTNLWLFSTKSDLIGNSAAGEMSDFFIKDYSVQIPCFEDPASSDTVFVVMECATGEDFNLHYFLGAPPFNL